MIDKPRSLYELWEEYWFGIGDNKAAKDFTTDDRNGLGKPFANKYSRRNRIWRIQHYLINCGLDIHAANRRIKDVYGTDRITSLIHIIDRDQKNPNYPFIGSPRNRQRFNPRIVVNMG